MSDVDPNRYVITTTPGELQGNVVGVVAVRIGTIGIALAFLE